MDAIDFCLAVLVVVGGHAAKRVCDRLYCRVKFLATKSICASAATRYQAQIDHLARELLNERNKTEELPERCVKLNERNQKLEKVIKLFMELTQNEVHDTSDLPFRRIFP